MPPRLSRLHAPGWQVSKLCFRQKVPLKSFSGSSQLYQPEDPSDSVTGFPNRPDIRPKPRRDDVQAPSTRAQQPFRRSPIFDLPPAPADAEPPTATTAPERKPKYRGAPPRDATNSPPLDAASTGSPSPMRQNSTSRLTDILERNYRNPAPRVDPRKRRAEMAAAQQRSGAVENLMSRVWRDGDVYSPHDLSPAEMDKARMGRQSTRGGKKAPLPNTRSMRMPDVVDELGFDPRLEYKNPALMGSFVTEMGRIKMGRLTAMRSVNQRKVAKAIRRARAMAMLPTVHKHPELHPERMTQRGQIENRSR